MADTKGNIQDTAAKVKVDGEEVEIAPGSVQSVTTSTPHAADESSAPGPYEGLDVDRPPVSTNDPETPIAHSLVAGAGAPTGEPDIHPETHVASNAYLNDADYKAGNVREMDVDKDGNVAGMKDEPAKAPK